MRLLILLSFCLVLTVAPKAQSAETMFFESLYDVPVMAGLNEVTEMGLSFDKAEGRIAYAAALSDKVDNKAILAFYGDVLPQMGWKAVSSTIFARERENLEISFEKVRNTSLIKFSLGPRLE